MILVLAGGVGGAKLAQGLASQLPPEELLIVVNTGDDFIHLGLHISPDVDTVMYWLAGLNDRIRGWGLAGETWNFMTALGRLGDPTWFRLGDSDLATHVVRTQRLACSETLSEVTRHLSRQLGIAHHVAPMSDDSVRTIIHTTDGTLAFQDYFVRLRCAPTVTAVSFDGIEKAAPSPAFIAAMADPHLRTIVICPSNPLLSIDPILSIPGVLQWLRQRRVPAVAVSPIVGGQAIKGPAAKILRELGRDVSVLGIAEHYRGLIDGLVIDAIDEITAPAIEGLGLSVTVTNTVMANLDDQKALASVALALAAQIADGAHA
ncbi:MAG: 2-phospho-L-lactate transferase [Pseudolabrys sp.]|jgi:LPPG:FO 2-phospho-L-lactate transferase|nr:2-phospho-L-lactate transferase [Pseudolabrys sp.]